MVADSMRSLGGKPLLGVLLPSTAWAEVPDPSRGISSALPNTSGNEAAVRRLPTTNPLTRCAPLACRTFLSDSPKSFAQK